MAGMGAMLAKDVPPPGGLKKGAPAPAGEGEPDADDASGDMEAAKLSAMEAFQEALKGSPQEALSAFDDLMGACGY